MTQESSKDELILKVLDGVATPEEIQTLARWINADSENEAYFNQLKKAWNLTSGPVSSVEREEKELKNYMVYVRSRQRIFRIRQVFKYVAIIMIPLLGGIYWLQKEKNSMKPQLVAMESKIVPGEYKATLTTSGGETIVLLPSKQEDIHVQENITVTNGQTGIVYQNTAKAASVLQYNTLKTPRGGEYTITLSDGSRVYLNASSELKYPVLFDEKKREVRLSGEAYFEVAKDSERPFYVVTNTVRIKVYGTSFNVNTYSTQGTQAVLVSGKVGIRGVGADKEYIMNPSELAEFDNDGTFKRIRAVNTSAYTAWRDGRLVFEDESLEEILNRLSRWYNVDVFYGSEVVKNYHFTGYMEKYEDVDTILKAISKMVGVNFIVKGKTITVTK